MGKKTAPRYDKLMFPMIVFLILSIKALANCWGSNVICYSSEEINFYDSELFSNNLNVVFGHSEISPRFFSLYVVYVFLKLGLTYEYVYLLVFFSILIITTYGLSLFVRRSGLENKNPLVAILLVLWVSFSRLSYFANFTVFSPGGHFMGLGASLALVGIIYAITSKSVKDQNVAYLLVSLGACFHIHEGLFGGGIVTLILFYKYRLNILKDIGLYLSIVVLLFLSLPPILTARPVNVDNFYDIYVNYRHPHHLKFSANILGVFVAITIYILIYSYLKYKGRIYESGLCKLFLCIFILTMLLWLFLCDIFKINLFVELYISKVVKYINVVFVFLLCNELGNQQKHQRFIFVLVLISCLNYRWELFLPVAIGILLIYLFFKNRILESTLIYTSLLSLLLWILPIIKNSDIGIPQALLSNKIGRMAYDFSKKTNVIIPPDKMFLADPKDPIAGYIQLISRRDAYVTHKGIPSYENAVAVWYERMMELENINQWNNRELFEFMKEKHLEYLIIKPNRSGYEDYFDTLLKSDIYSLLKIKTE